MFHFHKTTLNQCQSTFDAYLSTIDGVNDDFWEEHILKSQLYAIEFCGQNIGLTGIYQNENLTFFYMPLYEQRYAQQAFSDAFVNKPKE